MAKEDKSEPVPKPFFKLGKLSLNKKQATIFLAASVLIITTAVSLFLVIGNSNEEVVKYKPPAILEIPDQDNVLSGATYRFEPFVLNLSRGTGIIQLRVSIACYEFELPTYFNNLIPGFRDKIITQVSKYSADELLRDKNRQELKKSILIELNGGEKDIQKVEVVDVYFEEFNIR